MTIITDEVDHRTPIRDFYAGQNVLVTGGTGFLGKILIEKLLRSCPDLASIYMVVRPKKGKDIHNRIESIFDKPIFARLKKEVPKFRHKIVAIPGDCSSPGLGLSTSDKDLLLQEINIVFNMAATVRFDEKLNQAVGINVSGTKEILGLCRCMHNLRAVVHVSTAYSNCNRRDIEEKFYDPPITGDNVIKLVQSLDSEKLDAITPTLLGDFPNTYTYTKAIAEQVIRENGKDLPVGIFRPAIVVSSYLEPVEGWTDNMYGATGAIFGTAIGLVRTINVDVNCTAELVPVDFAVNALISTAWDVAMNKNEDAEPPIYNYHSSWSTNLTWGQYINIGMQYGKKVPSYRSMWCYSMTTTKNLYVFYLLNFLLHTLPALLIDMGLFMTGHKTRLLKLYKRVHKFSSVTMYFSTNEWHFSNDNMKTLWNKLSLEDQKIFFFSMENFDWKDYIAKCVSGVRFYMIKDDPNTIPAARKRMARFIKLHRIIKYTAITLFVWFSYLMISLVLSIGPITRFTSINENLITR